MKFKVGDIIFDKDSDASNAMRGLITEVDEKDEKYVIKWSFYDQTYINRSLTNFIDKNFILVNWNRAEKIWQDILNEKA